MAPTTEFQKRLIASSLSAIVVAFFLLFSRVLWVSLLTALTAAGLSGVACWEYIQLARRKGLPCALWLCVGASVVQTLAFFVALPLHMPLLPLVTGFTAVAVIISWHFRSPESSLASIACEVFPLLYIATPLGFMVQILNFPGSSGVAGVWWLFYLVAVTKVSDVGAYCAGKLFGRKRLAPLLSPKKTIEGAIGGLLASLGMSLLLVYAAGLFGEESLMLKMPKVLILGLLLGLLSQFGDLAESVFKRDAGVKDSNRLPGCGGILDLLDSLLFTAPFVYLYLQIWGRSKGVL